MSKIINVSFMITSDMISQGLLNEIATCQAPTSPQSQLREERLFTPHVRHLQPRRNMKIDFSPSFVVKSKLLIHVEGLI